MTQKLVTSLFIEGGQENIFIGPKNIFDQWKCFLVPPSINKNKDLENWKLEFKYFGGCDVVNKLYYWKSRNSLSESVNRSKKPAGQLFHYCYSKVIHKENKKSQVTQLANQTAISALLKQKIENDFPKKWRKLTGSARILTQSKNHTSRRRLSRSW